jgi:hypothetical protein
MIKSLLAKLEQCRLIFSSREYFLIRSGKHPEFENDIMVSSNMTAARFNAILLENKEEIDSVLKI